MPHNNWYEKRVNNFSHDFTGSKHFPHGNTAVDKANALLYHQNMDTPAKVNSALAGHDSIIEMIKELDYEMCMFTFFL
jgi:hypothetical protein